MMNEKKSPEEFSLYQWVATIPLCDDLWLGMQAQNVAVVDMTIMRRIEHDALEEYFNDDRISMPTLQVLSALSQMWIFSFYEFLRTWRQRARTLTGFADKLAALKTDKEREAYLNEITDGVKQNARFVKIAPVFYLDHVARVADAAFINSIRDYRDATDELFRDVEAIRMSLAKHEIAGTNKEKLIAEAPGYGRVSYFTGSMYWQIVLTDNTVTVVERRRLANKFLNLNEEDDIEADATVETDK
jgi:hypothetical protein